MALDLPENPSAIDVSDLKKDILNMPGQIQSGVAIAEPVDLSGLKGSYQDVIISGMGGSSIAALLLQSYLSDELIRINVNQDYALPKWAGKDTLVIISSYSGNTEESISAFKEARRAGSDIVVITCGGKLADAAKAPRLPLILLPSGLQPRASTGLQFFATLRLLERLGLVKDKTRDLQKVAEDLKSQLPELEKNAISLSEKLAGKLPIIFTGPRFRSVGYRWKCQFNENTKILAFNNAFSEMNHNEIEAFGNKVAEAHVIFLRFEEDHRRIQQRMDITKEIILRKRVPVTDIGIRSRNLLTKIFLTVLLGDLTSYYLALRLKTDPSKVDIIEDFKRRLGPFVG